MPSRAGEAEGCYLDVTVQNNFTSSILIDIQHSYIRLRPGSRMGYYKNYEWYSIERTSNQNVHGRERRKFKIYSNHCKISSTDHYEIKLRFTWKGEARTRTYTHPGGGKDVYLGRISMLFEV